MFNSTLIPVSRSQLLDIRKCPRMAALRYRIKLDPSAPHPGLVSPTSSVDLVYGTMVHYACELIVAPYLPGSTAPTYSLDELHYEVLSHPDWLAACQKGFYGVESIHLPAFIEMISNLLYGHLYIATTQVFPTYLSESKFISVEKELTPHTFDNLALQGRVDAIAITDSDLFEPEHILHSYKTAALYTSANQFTYLHDDQGFSESLLYSIETGVWPTVQMTYFLKGKATRDAGTITFSSPFTVAYHKRYKDGSEAWSPKYATGWEKRSPSDYPGGIRAYISEVLAQPEHAATLAATWARSPAVVRSQRAALDWLLGAKATFRSHYAIPVDDSPDRAMRSFDAWLQCVQYTRLCPYHEACQNFVPLSALNLVPRTPHHPSLEETGE